MSESLLWLAVAAGGAGGALVRATIYRVLERADGSAGVPGLSALSSAAALGPARATLVVNVLGSFLLGCLIGLAPSLPEIWDGPLRALVITGLCGAVTTFSTLCADAIRFTDGGDWRRAVAYLFAHAVLGIGAVFAALELVG